MRLVTFISFLFAASLTAFSQALSGQYTCTFTNLPLWDLGGAITNSVQGDTVTLQLAHGANGKFTGTRTEIAVTDTMNLYGSAYVTARTFWTPSSTGFVVPPYRGTLTGTVNDLPVIVRFTAHGKATLIPSQLALQTDSAMRVCVQGGRCVTQGQSFLIPLGEGMNGTWSLAITASTYGSKVDGLATVTLSNGRSLGYTVRGTYNPRRQRSTIRLVGAYETVGSSLVLTVNGTNMPPVSTSGRILGQRIKKTL